jgi:hypothetical protein
LDDLIVGSPYKIESDGSTLEAGKSYVIFGKIDSTAIDLSAIASKSTNNQIIQAIAVDIACGGD